MWKVEYFPKRVGGVVSLYGRCSGLESAMLLDFGSVLCGDLLD
jgi:hypothetical protein